MKITKPYTTTKTVKKLLSTALKYYDEPKEPVRIPIADIYSSKRNIKTDLNILNNIEFHVDETYDRYNIIYAEVDGDDIFVELKQPLPQWLDFAASYNWSSLLLDWDNEFEPTYELLMKLVGLWYWWKFRIIIMED